MEKPVTKKSDRRATGQTPVPPDWRKNLLINVETREEINKAEAENIARAMVWAGKSRKLKKELLTASGLILLHRRMFEDVWIWAGKFRTHDTQPGVAKEKIQNELKALLDDVEYWLKKKTFPLPEIAIRFHHRLVRIHPFENGNGRATRHVTDLLLVQNGEKRFTWSSANLIVDETERAKYIAALRKADRDPDAIRDLLKFAQG